MPYFQGRTVSFREGIGKGFLLGMCMYSSKFKSCHIDGEYVPFDDHMFVFGVKALLQCGK